MEKATDQQPTIHGTSQVIKQEKPEDREIRLMAAKMKEQHRQAAAIQQPPIHIQQPPIHIQQPPIHIQGRPTATTNVPAKRIGDQVNVVRFGWAELKQIEPGLQEKNPKVIPFLYRHAEKICSERTFQLQLREYQMHPTIDKCSLQLRKYEILGSEIRLLNEINFVHCDGQFGGEFTRSDKVLRLREALGSYEYRMECHRLLTSFAPGSIPKKCGFLQIEGATTMAFVAVNGVVHVPVFYFQDVPQRLMDKTQMLWGWDMAYLKFCCTVQGINPRFLAEEFLTVIPIDEIKNEIKENATVKYFWPPTKETTAVPSGSGTNVSSSANSQT